MELGTNLKVSCIVNYPYEASEPDELSIRPGDLVRQVERLPGGWWRGELRGQKGMFPDNFVSVINDQNNRVTPVQGKCRAVFSYQPANPDELPLCIGDTLEVLGEVEEGWWQGRRQGKLGVFPSNFVVMLDSPPPAAGLATHAPTADVAPALPPKPVKEQCRVLFPYAAVNEDELSLEEGDVVTVVSRDAPDPGWWRGELRGRTGLFPDNFVQLLPATPSPGVPQEPEDKKDKCSPKMPLLYPMLNKFSEKTSSIKELTTSKMSIQKDSSISKESVVQNTTTQTNKSETESLIRNETVSDGSLEKKPPVPQKKSPTPAQSVTGLLSGLKNKVLPSTDKEKNNQPRNTEQTDGIASSRNTFDQIERNAVLNDPRAARVKAPRRRPPSQTFREDPLTNGHDGINTTPTKSIDQDKSEEIKPRAREWERHRAPWMDELKLNQAKKTESKPRSSSTSSEGKAGGSTEKLLECGVEDRKSSYSMEMSKSTSSILNKTTVIEGLVNSFEESKSRNTEVKTENVESPTAAGRTISTMIEEIRKSISPVSQKPTDHQNDKSSRIITEKIIEKQSESSIDRSGIVQNKTEDKVVEKSCEKVENVIGTFERKMKVDKVEAMEMLISQLNCRVMNLEKLIEVQNAKFTAAVEELNVKLSLETERRKSLQAELEKFAQCVTQV